MDLVSSIIMLITSRLAAKPNIHKFPVVCQSERTRQTLSLTIAGSQKSRDCRDHSLLCFDDYCLSTVDRKYRRMFSILGHLLTMATRLSPFAA